MIWTIIKADLLWLLMTIPFTVGVQLLLAARARRASRRAHLSLPAWARGSRSPEQNFKLAQMRARGRKRNDARA
jgi:hypothetical protein